MKNEKNHTSIRDIDYGSSFVVANVAAIIVTAITATSANTIDLFIPRKSRYIEAYRYILLAHTGTESH